MEEKKEASRKTIDDIIAEKRARADGIEKNYSIVPTRRWDQEAEVEVLRWEADELEAALKREREEAKPEFVAAVTKAATQAVTLTDEKWKRELGNAAKLREAVVALLDECCSFFCAIPDQVAEGGQTCGWRYRPKNCGREAINLGIAALGTPARNCDMPWCTSYEAAVAMRLVKVGPIDKGGERGLVEWLLATATPDRLEAAWKRELDNRFNRMISSLYEVASKIRTITQRIDAKERGIACGVVREIAEEIEMILDKRGEQ